MNSIEICCQLNIYFWQEQQICVLDRLTVMKILLDRINLEVWVNTPNLKDKLRSVDKAHFKGDITSILWKIEDINSVILAERDKY